MFHHTKLDENLEGGHLWYEVILDRINNDPLCHNQIGLCLISLWNWNLLTDVRVQLIFFQDQGDPILLGSEVISSLKLFIKLGMRIHLN